MSSAWVPEITIGEIVSGRSVRPAPTMARPIGLDARLARISLQSLWVTLRPFMRGNLRQIPARIKQLSPCIITETYLLTTGYCHFMTLSARAITVCKLRLHWLYFWYEDCHLNS